MARCDITPPVGIYHRMWGAATHERATGIHRPLSATALVFAPPEGGEEAVQVLVAVDLCLLWAREMETLLTTVSQRTGLPREQLAVTFSHTHAAGLMGLERASLPGGELIPAYLDRLAGSVADIVAEALRSLQPVVLTYATGRCALAAHRDFWDAASGQFVCGFNPEGGGDDTVLVARITDAHDRLVATVVNYACHPTTLAWANTLLSPDYPGALREVVEQATGAPCVFLQGASGDLGPREGFVGDVRVADRNGRQLGHAALAALEGMPPPRTRFCYTGPVISGATLGSWAHLPLDEAALACRKRWRVRRWTVDLPYRSDLPDAEATRREREDWLAAEQQARRAGDEVRARDCRAMVERMDRRLTRVGTLPPGPTFPFPITLWQTGDAFWLALEAEPYNVLQRSLRERCAGHPLLVAVLTNGSRPSYLPARDLYGKGIYQESIAVLAPGSLEQLIDTIGEQLDAWREEPSA